MPRWFVLIPMFAALAGGCAMFRAPEEISMDNVPLIERRVLFGNPERMSVGISPDGTTLAWSAPLDGVLNLWTAPADDPEAARPITFDRHRGIRGYQWTHHGNRMIYGQDRDGDENWRLYLVDPAGGEPRELTPTEGVRASVSRISHKRPGEAILAINERDPRHFDLWLVDLETGERRLIEANTEGFRGYVIDDQLAARLAVRMTSDGGKEILRRAESGDWEPWIKVGLDDEMVTSPINFSSDGRRFFMRDGRGRDTSALVEIDMETGHVRLIAADDGADAQQVVMHPTRREPQAVAFTREMRRWEMLDEEFARRFESIRERLGCDITVFNRTLDDSRWIVLTIRDVSAGEFWLHDREGDELRFLFSQRPELEGLPLAPMHPVTITARDGLELVSYLSLPSWSDPDATGRPQEPLPMVLTVHGGPWGRDSWGFNGWHQWLANRGYAVLAVNFRGSTGFGKSFLNAGNFEWAGAMHDDLIDAVDWAVAAGIADPDRVAIMGASYGGYAALVGATFTPETFAAAVSVVGVSNLITLLESIPPYWEPARALWAARVGDVTTEEGRALLTARSPLTHVDRISRPLLIGHGANDVRCTQAESDQIVEAMRERGIPVTYALFPDEGHGFARPENRLAFNAVTELFLARVLGGRYEPIGEDFAGSSIQAPAGAGDLSGLAEALGDDS